MGLTRPVSLLGIDTARLTDVLVRQRHEDGRVFLSFRLHTEGIADGWRVTVTGPDGDSQSWEAPAGEVEIEQPQLWWPRGYGAQPLYTVRVELFCAGEPADVWERRIGLRTMRVHRARDKWGESFAHEVNGVCVFAMGADYIPEDCLLGRVTPSRTRHLLEQAALANFNTVRVWGGGYYPDDAFYDACDELGLLVWQDLMFACATYRLTESFEANITREIEENARRIRHHACLALWCGNNEMESFLYDGYGETPQLKGDYTRMYSYVIPKILRREDPDTFYWPSSPSSGGDFDLPQDETRGDAHYWEVWHGFRPFPEYRSHLFRYASEFGFESMPAMKTIESFTEPEESQSLLLRDAAPPEMQQRLRQDDDISHGIFPLSDKPAAVCLRLAAHAGAGHALRGGALAALPRPLHGSHRVAAQRLLARRLLVLHRLFRPLESAALF